MTTGFNHPVSISMNENLYQVKESNYMNVLITSHLKNFKANTTNPNRFIDIEFQNWNIVIRTLAAQDSSTMTTGKRG